MMTRTFVRGGLLVLAGFGLVACGGGDVAPTRQLFEGPVVSADYIGKSFPVRVLVGETGDPTASTTTGEGSVMYNSSTSIRVNLPGVPAFDATRSGSSALGVTYTGTPNGGSEISVTISDFSTTTAVRLITVAETDLAALGAFGFETVEGDRPASGTYDTAGSVFLSATNVGAILPVAGDGTLTADFTNGDISGTLLNADSASVAIAGAEIVPDDLTLTYTLENGTITSTGFRGDVGVSGELVVDGAGAPVVLDTAVTNDRVDGVFFGDEAEALAATFNSDVRLSDGATPLLNLEADGFLTGRRTGP